MDVSMPGYTALILGSVGLLTVAINTSSYRESGVLRRFRATPLRPVTYIAADVASTLVMMLAGMAPLLLAGWLIYDVRFEGQPVSVFLAVLLGGLAMFSVGYLIASLAPSARARRRSSAWRSSTRCSFCRARACLWRSCRQRSGAYRTSCR
jgi:ABC-2 type transport system permease protein